MIRYCTKHTNYNDLHSRTASHTTPLRASYGVSFWVIQKNDRNISGAHCKIWLLGFGGERHIVFHSSGLVSATYAGSRVLSYVMKASVFHNTLHVNNWHRVRDIPPLHDDVIKRMHFPRYRPLVWGIHQSTVNSPHKGQWHGALLFSLICVRRNGWVNNGDAGGLRRYFAHYGVIEMRWCLTRSWCSLSVTYQWRRLRFNTFDFSDHSIVCTKFLQ